MKVIIIGIAAAVLIAVGAAFALQTVQRDAGEAFTSTSARPA
jgi:uncharacterized protein YxeA